MRYHLRAASAVILVSLFGSYNAPMTRTRTPRLRRNSSCLKESWQCTREEGSGRTTPEIIVKGFHIILDGNKYQHIYGGKEKGSAGMIKIDPSTSPKSIEIEWINGSWKDQKQLGIYKLDGDKLEICWGELGGKTRPKKFATNAAQGPGNAYSKWTREKD